MKKRRDIQLIQRVARNVKYYRVKRGLTKEKLEFLSGLALARYESGENDMTLTTISILSKHLQVDPYQLLK